MEPLYILVTACWDRVMCSMTLITKVSKFRAPSMEAHCTCMCMHVHMSYMFYAHSTGRVQAYNTYNSYGKGRTMTMGNGILQQLQL